MSAAAENKRAFERYIHDFVNAGELDLAYELVAEDCLLLRGGMQRAAGIRAPREEQLGAVAEDAVDQVDAERTADVFSAAAGRERAGTQNGAEVMRQAVEALKTIFPDFRHEIRELIAEDDRVAYRLRLSVTQEGEFVGVPGSGRALQMDEIGTARFRDGKIVEMFALGDELGLLQQLGFDVRPPA